MTQIQPTEHTVQSAASVVPSSFVDRVMESLGSGARAETIFGAAVQNNGMTVIPVGKVRLGIGGGVGRSAGKDEEGSGIGGGLSVSPVGYIELNGEGVIFRPIRSIPTILASFAAGILAGALAARRLMSRSEAGTTGVDNGI